MIREVKLTAAFFALAVACFTAPLAFTGAPEAASQTFAGSDWLKGRFS